jgi:hypothetical protein
MNSSYRLRWSYAEEGGTGSFAQYRGYHQERQVLVTMKISKQSMYDGDDSILSLLFSSYGPITTISLCIQLPWFFTSPCFKSMCFRDGSISSLFLLTLFHARQMVLEANFSCPPTPKASNLPPSHDLCQHTQPLVIFLPDIPAISLERFQTSARCQLLENDVHLESWHGT